MIKLTGYSTEAGKFTAQEADRISRQVNVGRGFIYGFHDQINGNLVPAAPKYAQLQSKGSLLVVRNTVTGAFVGYVK